MARSNPPSSKSGAFALGSIVHDGVAYGPGDELPAMSEEQLAALQAAGVVSGVAPVLDDARAAADPQP